MPISFWQATSFLKILFILFLKKGREGEREGEKHQCVAASHVPPTGNLAHNPGMCPDWESNWSPFDLQASTQSTEPHQSGLTAYLFTSASILLGCLLCSRIFTRMQSVTRLLGVSRGSCILKLSPNSHRYSQPHSEGQKGEPHTSETRWD